MDRNNIDNVLDNLSLKEIKIPEDFFESVNKRYKSSGNNNMKYRIIQNLAAAMILIFSIAIGLYIGLNSTAKDFTREENLNKISNQYYSDFSEKEFTSINK